MRLALGNRDAIEVTPATFHDDGTVNTPQSKKVLDADKRCCYVSFPPERTVSQAFIELTSVPNGIWAAHAAEGAQPAWIAGDNEALVSLLSSDWSGIEVRPLEWPGDAPVTEG